MADPVTWSIIAGVAVSAAATSYTAYEGHKAANADLPAAIAPNIPQLQSLPQMPAKPALAQYERSSELTRQAERRKRSNTLLTGMAGAPVSGANVAKSLLGQ